MQAVWEEWELKKKTLFTFILTTNIPYLADNIFGYIVKSRRHNSRPSGIIGDKL